MQPCKSINCFFDDTFRVPVEVQMQRVYDGGFRHVDMNFWDWSHDPASPFRADNWKEWVRGIAKAAARIGLKFTQAHSHVYNFYQFPETNIHKEMVLRSIEGAGMLGIPWIVMHCSTRPDFAENGSTEQRIADNIAFFREMAAFAAQFGVGIAVENASGVYPAQELIAIVDGVGLNNIGICWDTGHANMKTPDQCAQLRALAGMMTDTTPLVLVLALDESGMPVYVELFDATTDDSGFYAGLMVYPGEEPNTTIVSLSFYTSAAGGEPIASFSAAVVATVDPADPNVMDAAFYMDVMQGSMTLMNMEMSIVSAAATTEEGLPGYTQDVVMNMNLDAYGETGSSQMVGSVTQQMTADGGEYITSVSEMYMDVEGEKTQQITAQEMMIAPVEGGFAGSMTEMMQMPDQGMTMAVISEFGSWTHEPAALTETALENATNDEFDALIGRLTDGASVELNKLMSLLPPEVVEAFLE
ncbi:MAG: sugar phosphate isomerase/epimerase [Clostridia bacterium]|nr:sugar phosphate isomerase/epimerase [Clostridia bacterium]